MDTGFSPRHRIASTRRSLVLLRYFLLASAALLSACGGSAAEEEESAGSSFNQPPIISLTATPSSVASSASSRLDWLVRNATRCEASGAWAGEKGRFDSETVGPLTSTSVFTLSCSGPGGATYRSVTVDVAGGLPPPAPTVSLNANPTSVSAGAATTLSWSSANASSCTASGAWSGPKASSGSQSTGALTATSTFGLSCSGAGGSASQSVTVSVGPAAPPPPAPTVSFTVSPSAVDYNGAATLSWTSSDATSCTASGAWSGSKALSGSELRSSLTVTSTFFLACDGAGGSATRSVTVSVASPPLPTITLTANPTTVSANGSSTLTWSTANATSCSAGGAWSGSKATSGSQSVGPLADTSVFTLTCSGPGGSTNRPVTVTVQAANGTADLSWIAPQTNEDGSPVNLTGFNIYQGSSATSLSKIATVGASTTTFTVNSLPAGTHYFAVTAVGNGGTESQKSNVESKTVF